MKTQLYKYDGTPLFEVLVDASSSQSWSLMSDNKLSLSFELEECVVLTAGCYIEFDNTRFYLLTEYKPTMVCRSAWKYDLTLGDAASWLSITLALKTTDGENAPLFKYTGPAVEHAAIIVANLNRLMGTDKWKVGSVISTENITIDYSGKYCSEVLQEIVDTKNTEWWIDDMTLNIGRAEFGDPIELGYQNGLLGDIIREQSDNSKSYRYLYPVGSTRNIDPTKYGYDRLQLPDGRTYIDMNVEQGIAELFEEAAFAHIFPRYEGTVQTVRTQIANGNSGPFVIYYFSDSNIPFNPNDYEIAGLKKQISFLSGELMGEDFEVNYNPSSKEFEIITKYPESSNNIQLPGGLLIPNIGDKYVIWNITMPAEYYSLASQELLEAAEAFAQKYIYDGGIYHASLDYIDVQLRSLRLRPGQRVRLQSPEYFPKTGHYDSRITRVTRSLWYPNEMNIDISSERSMGVIKKLSSDVKSAQTKSNTLSATLSTLNAAFVAHKMLFDEFFEKDSAGNIHAKLSLWSSGGITAGGVGSGGSGGGGGISYNRLDSWSDYTADKSGWVLSALLGKDLDDRVSALANAGYITQSALAPYALRSEIPSLAGYATQSWVGENYLSKSGGKLVYSGAQGLEAERTDGAPSHIMFIGVVNGTSRQLGGFGMNGYNDPVYVNPNGIRHKVLTAENYTALLAGYATESWVGDNYLSKSGGVITGQGDTRYVQLRLDGEMSTVMFQQRGIEKGSVGWWSAIGVRLQNTNAYGLAVTDSNDPIYYWGQNGSVQRILLHAGNYADYITNSYLKSTLGISDWALAATKPSYTATEVGALSVNGGDIGGSLNFRNGSSITCANGIVLEMYAGVDTYLRGSSNIYISAPNVYTQRNVYTYKVLDSGNYSSYALPITGGTVNGSITANSFVGNLTGNADSATYILTKLTSGDAFYPDKYKAYIQWVSEDTAVMKFTDGDYQFRANSATKLATPRTIWGQSFDGTQDITGALTAPVINTNTLKVGNVTLVEENGALKVIGGFIATGGVTSGEKAS